MLSNITFIAASSDSLGRLLHEQPFVMSALIDVDDFELFRSVWGSRRATRELVDVTGRIDAALHDVGASARAAVVGIDPDAWIVTFHGGDAEALRREASAFSTVLQRMHMNGSPMSVTIGLGSAVAAPSGLQDSLAQAQSALERKLVEGGAAVFASPAPADLPYPAAAVAAAGDTLRARLIACARQRDLEGMSRTAEEWLDSVASFDGVTASGIRELTASVLLALAVELAPETAQSATWQERADIGTLRTIASIAEIHDRSYLRMWLQHYLQDVIESLPQAVAPSPVLAVVESHLRENYASPSIRLETVARATHISPYYISHLFQKERGTTFLRFLTDLRIARARQLLETTDLPIESICQAVGYNSASRFRINFKQVVGIAPRDYRLRTSQRETQRA